MTRFKLKLLHMATFFMLCTTTLAQAESIQKLGFIDTERVWRESKQAQQIIKTLNQEFASRQQQLEQMQQQGMELEAQLENNNNPNEKENILKKLKELDKKFRQEQTKFNADFDIRRNEEFAALQQNANKVIFALAKRDGYDVILKDVVFINSKFDITDHVIREMNK